MLCFVISNNLSALILQNALHLSQIRLHMKISTTISLCFILVGIQSFAQSGSVEIIKDSRIDNLVRNQGAIIPPATGPQINGYRIQLFFDSNKQLVDQARVKFITKFPKVDTYVIYNAPNYFLKVGDFRTQLEADKVKQEVASEFPTSFVIKEKINLPRID